jgi:hypothetical protein
LAIAPEDLTPFLFDQVRRHNCDRRVSVTPDEIVASGCLGQYRKHSGWDEWAGRFPNSQWLMELVFRRAGEVAARKVQE